jgi:hypothetical protein
MASPAQSVAIPGHAGLPLVRRDHARWLVRAPGQRGALSPEEAAHALKAKRAELRKRLDWRRDVAGLPEHVRDELVDEAIGLVVMSSKPIRDEQHLQGAFWSSIGYLLMAHRSGREQLSNVVDLAVKDVQAATLSSVVWLSWFSSFVTLMPSLNFTPSSTSATSSWPLKRRQRSWALSSSL